MPEMPIDHEKKRILFINLYAEMGGGEVAIYNIVKNLDRTKFDPVMMFNRRGAFVDKVETLGVQTVLLPYPTMMLKEAISFHGLRAVVDASREFEKYLRQHAVDIIHCGDVLVLLFIARSVLKFRIPVVYNVIFLYEWMRMILFNLCAIFLVKKIITNSALIGNNILHRTIALRDKIETIPLGVDTDIFHTRKNEELNLLRKEYNLPDDTKLVGMIARFDPMKGHKIFLRAAKEIVDQRDDVKFFVVGGALLADAIPGIRQYRDNVMRLYQELQLTESVTFIDEHPDVPAVMRSLDLIVCPSWSEGFGLVVLEALASGVPVVASRSVGSVEYVAEEKGVVIAQPGKSSSFASAILDVLEHLKHHKTKYLVSENFREQFTWQSVTTGYEQVYTQITRHPERIHKN